MKKVLVAGSEGFIGKNLVCKLLKRNYAVYGISKRQRPETMHGNYHYTSMDVLDRKKVDGLFRQGPFDSVIYLASITAYQQVSKDKEPALQLNTTGLINFLENVAKNPQTKFVFASNGKVYGEAEKLPLSEDQRPNPINIFGKIKWVAEKLIDLYSHQSRNRFVILRIFNVYGPGQGIDFLVPTILSQLMDGNGEVTLGDIYNRRDYIYIDDVVSAIELLLEHELPPGLNIFNAGNGQSFSAYDIVKTIEEILGEKIMIKTDQSKIRKNEPANEYADIDKLLSLGWSPNYDLKTGLEKTISCHCGITL